MKARKTIGHPQLVAEVLSQLSFFRPNPKVTLVLQRLDGGGGGGSSREEWEEGREQGGGRMGESAEVLSLVMHGNTMLTWYLACFFLFC